METIERRLDRLENLMSSEPTYEGWKQIIAIVECRPYGCSEPTYEGWKLDLVQHGVLVQRGSEPTYEGWKPVIGVALTSSEAWFRAYL